MPTEQVTMTTKPNVKPVSSGAKVQLAPEATATAPFTWTKNDQRLTPDPAVPYEVDPSVGKDDVYTIVDNNQNSFSAVVAWKPAAPIKPELKPGKGAATVSWEADPNETRISYYEVDLKDPDDQRPAAVQLPRRVKQSAVIKGTKRAVVLESVPPGFYSAHLRAVREGDHGSVESDDAITSQGEILPANGKYPAWVRGLLFVVGVVAVCVAVWRLIHNPHSANPASIENQVSLDGWALVVAAIFVLGLVLMLSGVVRIRDLLSGPDNRISTSRINVALWTVAIAFGITTLAALAFGASQYHQLNRLIAIDGVVPV